MSSEKADAEEAREIAELVAARERKAREQEATIRALDALAGLCEARAKYERVRTNGLIDAAAAVDDLLGNKSVRLLWSIAQVKMLAWLGKSATEDAANKGGKK